ncbi:lipoyl amidotransferase LIPT1, mitochondrial-like, partial [Saccoglossus kowalevskii]
MALGLVIFRRFCSSAGKSLVSRSKKGIVYCSTSTDVYANLAFEDWAYENWNFSDVHMLLLWRNDASVVIGRHQNPWNECDIPKLQHHNVKLARRKSGGGAVYHDLGNLNISFFTSRKKYDRRANLTLIMTALQNSWPHIDINLSHRDDLMLNKDYKISGSAAKLGRTTAYHHCTLLFDVNTSLLNDILQSHLTGLDSIATESVRSEVKNLMNVDSSINFPMLVNSIGHQFYQQYPAYHTNE